VAVEARAVEREHDERRAARAHAREHCGRVVDEMDAVARELERMSERSAQWLREPGEEHR
jgi:hypothetical protein